MQLIDSLSFLDMYADIITREIYRFETELSSPFIIDCGANIGLSVIYFKRLYPNSTVLAFEPDFTVFSALSANIKAFDLTGVVLRNEAVWSSDGVLDFLSEGSYAGRVVETDSMGTIFQVTAIRLRDFLDKQIDLLKLDIEGAETSVLLDCADRLSNVQRVFVEYHSFERKEQHVAAVIETLCDAGFRLHIQAPASSPQPFVARACPYGMDMQLNIFAFRPEIAGVSERITNSHDE